MTAATATRSAIERWAGTFPTQAGTLAVDAGTLRRFTARGEELLAALPGKPERTSDDQERADEIHHWCRRLRTAFLHTHSDSVHARLTGGQAVHPRIAELVHLAAEEFPGLVPTSAQIAQERTRIQVHKECREIDQGIFFRAMLGSPTTGRQVVESMLRPTTRAELALPEFRRTGRAELGCVRLERQGAAAHLTIRNLHCLNAEDDPSVDDMETAVDLVLLDDSVRVGVVRGGPMTHHRYLGRRVFSAGINLRDLHDGRISFVDFLLRREIGYLSKMCRGLLAGGGPAVWTGHAIEKPWVAAVDTFAIGGGAQMLLVFDEVIAAADSYLSLPAAREGIVPGVANLRLPRIAGPRLARQIILGGRRILATDAEARLFVDEVAQPAGMDSAVDAAVERMAAPAVVANRRMLNLAEEPLDTFRTYLAEFAVQQAIRAYAPDVAAKTARFSR
jgi:thioesterase DpgC